ncbi:MAG: Endonuclease III [uncultured Thermomicrobiales bacterium]|uniref:Endonuclease III n=1 Tax=uncultured Thermomicrobiales bacterium TaxID=1645740 RepID=A0A6J4VJY6_9BACT|nr:MAG: Endonuclease III [uncultured Thermomicrobiales bacterium]
MTDQTPRPDFPIDAVLGSVRAAVKPFPPAVMFELADRGFSSLFHQLIACIVSVRTREEETLPICLRLFGTAPDAATLAALAESEIDRLIRPSTFHEQKAGRIREIARIAMTGYGDGMPCDRNVVMALPGVGPKCANLALGIACGLPLIGVDIHVHRIVNRWGYVRASTPERTLEALGEVLPERYRVEINRLLVPFGKQVCTGARPWCSRCPVRAECWRVGVTEAR